MSHLQYIEPTCRTFFVSNERERWNCICICIGCFLQCVPKYRTKCGRHITFHFWLSYSFTVGSYITNFSYICVCVRSVCVCQCSRVLNGRKNYYSIFVVQCTAYINIWSMSIMLWCACTRVCVCVSVRGSRSKKKRREKNQITAYTNTTNPTISFHCSEISESNHTKRYSLQLYESMLSSSLLSPTTDDSAPLQEISLLRPNTAWT